MRTINAIALAYDAAQDRVLAVINPGALNSWSYWLTRRLILQLLGRLPAALAATSKVARQAPVEYRGELDRTGKIAFLRSLDVMSVPATYAEPKGIFLLEAMAVGIPVVQPRRGAFPEILEKTGGGILVDADDPDALAKGFRQLQNDPALASALGAAGAAGVRAHYTASHMAERVEEIYAGVIRQPRASPAA